jgi:hypothetical protein
MFPQLKIKLKGRRFVTLEMIEAELQAVLNTLTDHDFQDAFKKIAEGTTSRVVVASRPKVSF